MEDFIARKSLWWSPGLLLANYFREKGLAPANGGTLKSFGLTAFGFHTPLRSRWLMDDKSVMTNKLHAGCTGEGEKNQRSVVLDESDFLQIRRIDEDWLGRKPDDGMWSPSRAGGVVGQSRAPRMASTPTCLYVHPPRCPLDAERLNLNEPHWLMRFSRLERKASTRAAGRTSWLMVAVKLK